jgi:hypothetical protein
MKKFSKQYILSFFQITLSLGVILSFGSCISDCDTTNSTTLIAGFDTAGKVIAVKYTMADISGNKIYDSNTKRDTSRVYLDLNNDTTVAYYNLYYPKEDVPVTDTIIFTYNPKAFARGPDCGIDVRIQDLAIGGYTENTIDTVFVVKKEITSTNNFNVKIRLK